MAESKKIMIVEDENILVINAQKMLKKYGYDVSVTASTGEEAVIKAEENRPDLILMDVKLKGEMDGVEAARQIQDIYSVPIVFTTAFADDSTMKRARETTPFGYLIKPVKEKELKSTIDISLYKHKMEMQERHNREIQESLNAILRILLEPIPFNDQLLRILEIIVSIPWLTFQKKGAVFIFNRELNVLDLKVSTGFSNEQTVTCKEVSPGHCLCGWAAESKSIIFSNHIDENHTIRYDKMTPHGHYCIPIMSGRELLGVLNLYVSEGHQKIDMEERFLLATTDILAALILQNRSLEKMKRLTDVIEATSDIVGIADMEGNFTYLNNAGLEVVQRDKTSGIHLKDIHPEWANKIVFEDAIPSAFESGKWRGESAFVGRDGEEIPVSQVILSHSDTAEGFKYFSTIARDISDTKKLEKEIIKRLYFEENLLLIAKIFGSSQAPDVYQVLNFLGDAFQVDVAYIFLLRNKSYKTEKIYDWFGKEAYNKTSHIKELDFSGFPWTLKRFSEDEKIVVYDIESLPSQAAMEREFWSSMKMESFVAAPIKNKENELLGVTMIASIGKKTEWTKEQARIIRIINEIISNYLERKEARNKIASSLNEKEVLLKEIHHRVKNNLQLISSLMYLQSQNMGDKDPMEVLNESQNRIRSMAMIHEKLYQSTDFSSVNFEDYLRDLTGTLFHSYKIGEKMISLNLEVGEIPLDVNLAIPCALIINELLSNALKHAFGSVREGKITIVFHYSENNRYTLIVKDNGIGFPKDKDFREMKTLGMQLVKTLSEKQLKGAIELNREQGTEFRIDFPG